MSLVLGKRILRMKKLIYFLVTLLFTLAATITISCGGGGGGGTAGPADTPSSAPTNTSSAPVLSAAADVVSFTFESSQNDALSDDLTGNSPDNQNIIVSYNYGTLDTQPSLKPTITVSPSAQIIDDGFIETDANTNTWTLESPADFFTNPVSFTVKAENGNEKEWSVSLEENAPGVYNIHYYYSPDEPIINSPFPTTYDESVGIDFNNYTSYYNKVCLNNYYFDGWCEDNGSPVTSWDRMEKNGDVDLYAKWQPAPYADLSNNKIFANGLPVTVKNTGSTMVYFTDANGNEKSLYAVNENYTDFTGYDLYAGTSINSSDNINYSNSIINGNITITGGTLNNVYGCNEHSPTPLGTSTIKLSGNPEIGDKLEKGIRLNSFTGNTVKAQGSISTTDGKITLIAPAGIHAGTDVVQEAGAVPSVVNYTLRNSFGNETIELATATSGSNLIVNESVGLPDSIDITNWANDPVDGACFTVGSGHIHSNGTILSIGVEDGFFKVPYTDIPNADFDMAIKYTGNSLNEYLDDDGLTTSLKLKYVQFKSLAGTISADDASDFLANIHFFIAPNKTQVKIKLNLQTVSLTEIQAKGVTYYNGSFYKIKNGSSDKTTDWNTALTNAKSDSNKFNGLTGYLMTITSQVENMFIYDRVYKKEGISQSEARGWIGAKRENGIWKWACGPEEGTPFYNQSTKEPINGSFAAWDSFKDRIRNGTWSLYGNIGINDGVPLYDINNWSKTNYNGRNIPNEITELANTHSNDKWYWPEENKARWYVDWDHPKSDKYNYAYYTGIYAWGNEKDSHGYIIEYTSYNGPGGTPTAPVLVAEQTYSQ